MYRYKFLEVIRDYETLEVIKAALLYEKNGNILRTETSDEKIVDTFIYNFNRQNRCSYEDLVSRGFVHETTNREIRSGAYRPFTCLGYHFPCVYFEDEEEIREKMGFPISFCGDYIIWIPRNKKIGVTPSGLFHLAKGGFGLVEKKKLRNKYKKIVNYTDSENREFKRYYSKFDKMLKALIDYEYDEIDFNKIDKFTSVLHQAYEQNFKKWRRVDNELGFFGAQYRFSAYYNPNSIDYKFLNYFENKYNHLVYVYISAQVETCTSDIASLFHSFYGELYDFVFDNRQNYLCSYEQLNNATQLILVEMLQNLQLSLNQTYIISNVKDNGKMIRSSKIMDSEINKLKMRIYKSLKDNAKGMGDR